MRMSTSETAAAESTTHEASVVTATSSATASLSATVRCEPGRRYLVPRGSRVELAEQFFSVR